MIWGYLIYELQWRWIPERILVMSLCLYVQEHDPFPPLPYKHMYSKGCEPYTFIFGCIPGNAQKL